jgi:hypothetical protein
VLEVSKEVLDGIPMLFSWIRVELAEYPNGLCARIFIREEGGRFLGVDSSR